MIDKETLKAYNLIDELMTNNRNEFVKLAESRTILRDILIKNKYCRQCDACHQGMNEGYCIESDEYYCSDDCLHTKYTNEEWLDLYDDGNSGSFWTEWYDEPIEDYIHTQKEERVI